MRSKLTEKFAAELFFSSIPFIKFIAEIINSEANTVKKSSFIIFKSGKLWIVTDFSQLNL